MEIGLGAVSLSKVRILMRLDIKVFLVQMKRRHGQGEDSPSTTVLGGGGTPSISLSQDKWRGVEKILKVYLIGGDDL